LSFLIFELALGVTQRLFLNLLTLGRVWQDLGISVDRFCHIEVLLELLQFKLVSLA